MTIVQPQVNRIELGPGRSAEVMLHSAGIQGLSVLCHPFYVVRGQVRDFRVSTLVQSNGKIHVVIEESDASLYDADIMRFREENRDHRRGA